MEESSPQTQASAYLFGRGLGSTLTLAHAAGDPRAAADRAVPGVCRLDNTSSQVDEQQE